MHAGWRPKLPWINSPPGHAPAHASATACQPHRRRLAAHGPNRRPALTGAEIEQLDDAPLREVGDAVDVFARASPEHKIRLVQALQSRGEVVAMTGDGVNDAPGPQARRRGRGHGPQRHRGRQGLLGNPQALIAIAACALLQLAFVHAPWLQAVFGSTGLAPGEWLRVVLAGAAVFAVAEGEKLLLRSRAGAA